MFEIDIIHNFSLEIPVVEFNESLRGIQILEGLEINENEQRCNK